MSETEHQAVYDQQKIRGNAAGAGEEMINQTTSSIPLNQMLHQNKDPSHPRHKKVQRTQTQSIKIKPSFHYAVVNSNSGGAGATTAVVELDTHDKVGGTAGLRNMTSDTWKPLTESLKRAIQNNV